jgi:tripartite-type tricarboxylate transporter receptor subunit TctC
MALRKFPWVSLALGLLAVISIDGVAQDYPVRPVTMVIGYAPGGAVDIPARYFAKRLSAITGQPFVIENRPGALTNIAAESVARAKPDGYTLFMASGNATMASNPHIFKKLPFDPVKDFTPVATLFRLPFLLVVNAKTPVNSVVELTAYMKKKGTAGNYGYAGSFALIASELYKSVAGLQTQAISYKVPQQSIPALISGELDFLIQDSANVLRQVAAGTLKALAVTPSQRSALIPEVPTMEEAGVPGYDLSGWFALYLPANAPPTLVARLQSLFGQFLTDDETKKTLGNIGTEPFPGNAQFLAQLQARELEKWGRLHKLAKIEPE